jgi:outer membrane murein-binding lipoprotein Lpp
MRDVDIIPCCGHFSAMNTMSILLGATFALLLAAVVLSFQNMNHGIKNAPPEELARLQIQVEKLTIEQERWKLERDIQAISSEKGVGTMGTDVDKIKAELAAKEAEIEALAEDKLNAEKKASTFQDEAALIGQRELEKGDNELRRARLIRDALLIGRVTEYIDDTQVGGVAAIQVLMPELIKIGDVLAIRRNTGILGKLKITSVSADGAIGSPMPGFGPVVPEAGDELIIAPQI